MPAPRDILQFLRNLFIKIDPRRPGPGPGTEVFARAHPEIVRVTERYSYKQEISRNPSNERSEAPTGQIEIVVPFDGADHFTREACDDVAAALLRQPSGEAVSALIGHLVFARHQQTDLGERLGLDDTYGSLPIRVPVFGEDSPGGVDELSTDRHACAINHDYTPGGLDLIPIQVLVDLLDPDTVSKIEGTVMTEQNGADLSDLSKQPEFESFLWLKIQVRLILPWKDGGEPPRPVIDRVALDWPSITSLHALTLWLPDREDPSAPITYNPVGRSIEWRNVPMSLAGPQDERDDELVFTTRPMVLAIEQPGELYQQSSLDGQVEVKVPDCLVSGMRSRVFDGTGRKADCEGHEEVSWISSRFQLILDDAFARRPLAPHQHLHFGEVIPNERRIDDIKNALQARGFKVDFTRRAGDGTKQQWVGWANRPEGPEKMRLKLFVEGIQYDTDHRVQRGSQVSKRVRESGEIQLFVVGTLPGTSQVITREMNALHASIRERFARARVH